MCARLDAAATAYRKNMNVASMTAAFPAILIAIPAGVIDLGWGHPSPRLHPLEALQQAIAHMFAQASVTSLQYGAEQGFGPLLETLAAFLSGQEAYAMSVQPETLFLTNGASQALDLACTLLTNAGDTVLVEAPTSSATGWRMLSPGASVLDGAVVSTGFARQLRPV